MLSLRWRTIRVKELKYADNIPQNCCNSHRLIARRPETKPIMPAAELTAIYLGALRVPWLQSGQLIARLAHLVPCRVSSHTAAQAAAKDG
jgi:hypothetical protein